MKKLDLAGTEKLKTHPLFKDLPENLKDKVCYSPIETALRNCMFSDHTHKTVKGFVKCKRCSSKLEKRKALIKEFGFASYEQYLMWKRVMSIIIAEQDFVIS